MVSVRDVVFVVVVEIVVAVVNRVGVVIVDGKKVVVIVGGVVGGMASVLVCFEVVVSSFGVVWVDPYEMVKPLRGVRWW